MIGYKTHWYGKEVEGRFTDIETLFIADMKATYEATTNQPERTILWCKN